MRYTLAQNAISSLSIAIENFKKFYYHSEEFNNSKKNEAIKICIIFLENSIELMLKTILASIHPLSIYEQPDSRIIQNALAKTDEQTKLEDILIADGNFKTITYTDAVKKYNNIYHKSSKVFFILNSLGQIRNSITHFGIDKADAWETLIVSILNSFDVIYNYLYPQLIKIDSINDYFTSDDLFVETVHGVKPLFDNDFIYNNVIDFLDELLETSKDYVCSLRAANPKSKINQFSKLIKILFEDVKFSQMISSYNAKIKFFTVDFERNDYYFQVDINSKTYDDICSCYSVYNNVTAFCGESGNIYFLIHHDRGELYIYNSRNDIQWPQSDEAEPDNQWLSDCKNGFCKKYNLSKRNLLIAFQNIFIEQF